MESIRAHAVRKGDTIVDDADESVYYILDVSDNGQWFGAMRFAGGSVHGPMNIGPYNAEDGAFYRINSEVIPYEG